MSTTINLEPGRVTQLPISNLRADPDQPRKTFDEKGLESLATSLKAGVQVPLLVRPAIKKGNYIIHDGERRYRAASIAKLKTLPVLLIDAVGESNDIRVTQLTVNNERESLRPMEIARVLADMRKNDFATINDLAAFLDRTGAPAMTKQQIGDAIALVDLPEWAHDMIDAGQAEPAALRKLTVALPYENVIGEAKEILDGGINWVGSVTSQDVSAAIKRGFCEAGKDLGEIQSWYTDPVHFDAAVACKGCDHLVKTGGEMYCMDLPAFEKKNAEAKEAGLLPGGEKPKKPITPGKAAEQDQEDKAAKRTMTLGEKARAYLHTYLVNRIVAHMLAEEGEIDITEELLAWHAMKRPGEYGYGMPACVAEHVAAHATETNSFDDLINATGLVNQVLHAAVQVATSLAWRETQVICHYFWGPSVDSVWKLDADFLKLFRKAELIHLATTHELEPPEGKGWDKLKLSELRSDILDQGKKVAKPQILSDLYADVAKPYKRTSYQ